MFILNKFIINTVDFLNKFASTAEEVVTLVYVVSVHSCAYNATPDVPLSPLVYV